MQRGFCNAARRKETITEDDDKLTLLRARTHERTLSVWLEDDDFGDAVTDRLTLSVRTSVHASARRVLLMPFVGLAGGK